MWLGIGRIVEISIWGFQKELGKELILVVMVAKFIL